MTNNTIKIGLLTFSLFAIATINAVGEDQDGPHTPRNTPVDTPAGTPVQTPQRPTFHGARRNMKSPGAPMRGHTQHFNTSSSSWEMAPIAPVNSPDNPQDQDGFNLPLPVPLFRHTARRLEQQFDGVAYLGFEVNSDASTAEGPNSPRGSVFESDTESELSFRSVQSDEGYETAGE